ncbi:J domain-containing protein [Altericista sp. CCNU0014]|uniref:J domain-containing protein n=1 Tax=Altericista sp. CCNU0014 TaxID=3082949 RepID=UPI00384F4E5E
MPTYYERLDLSISATAEEVRRAYRLKSKLYHPDTTTLPPAVAIQKFRELKEAYAVLNTPERRAAYDAGKWDKPPVNVPIDATASSDNRFRSSSAAYLDPKERPLSPGEIFAVFLLGITFVVCLVLAIVLGVARGEMVLQTSVPVVSALQQMPSGTAASLSSNIPSLKRSKALEGSPRSPKSSTRDRPSP